MGHFLLRHINEARSRSFKGTEGISSTRSNSSGSTGSTGNSSIGRPEESVDVIGVSGALNVDLPQCFWKLVMGGEPTLEDIGGFDPTLYQNLLWVQVCMPPAPYF